MREIHYTVCQLYCQERIPFANDASGLFLQFFFIPKLYKISVFHLSEAAKMGHLDAMSVYSKKLLGIQSEVLEEIVVEPDLNLGWKILCEAGVLGDSYAFFLTAR